MRKIKDEKLINRYIEKYNFYAMFDHNIADSVELLYFEPGEYLINHNVVSKYLLFLVQGECRFFTIANDGNYVSFGSTKTFEVFGEVSSLWNLPPNNVVQAIKPTYCLGINLHKYRDIILNDTSFLRYLCRLLSNRVLNSNRSLTSFVGAKAENRLATYIIQNKEKKLFSKKLTVCAEAIGVSYRHLQRLMDRFCKENILKKDGRKYHIIDEDKLKNMSVMK